MKVALVYDRVNKWGGAERVLLALHELFPSAPLYTSVYNPKKAPWAQSFKVKTSFLQHFPFASFSHEYYAALMPLAFESFSFDEYDVVISVTSEAAKGVITKPKTLHLCYCLTPTRYLWSGYEDYFQNPFLKTLSKPAVSYLRMWDRVASQRPDMYVAISTEVQNRIKKYYNRESEVIYPPISTAFSSEASSVQLENDKLNAKKLDAKRSSYFLIVSRLISYKKIDIAIKACNALGFPLRIVGTGSGEMRLRGIADSTVEFLGNLTDEKLVEYYKGCRALICTANEDLGLSIVEAHSFGKPVIAYKRGGALDTVVEGKTGEFFYPQNEDALIKKMLVFKEEQFDSNACKKQAQKFNLLQFRNGIMKAIETGLKKRNYSI